MRRNVPCVHCGLPAAAGDGPAYCCLGCRIAYQIAGAGGSEGEARWVQARFLLAALFGVAVMTLSLILYTEELFASGIEATALGQLLRWALLALATPVLFLLAPSLVEPGRAGWQRLLTLELWILVAVAAAWSLSSWRVLQGSGALYFESAAMVLVLVTLGRYLDARCRVRVGAAAAELRALLPDRVRVIRDGALAERAVDTLAPGEVVRVLAGERCPVDGTVVEGEASCDFAAFTGEHAPRTVLRGHALPATALVLDGALEILVTRRAGERSIDRVAAALEEARSRRTPALRAADRLTAWFLPSVLLLALAVLVGHGSRGDWETGTLRALAVLLVSCPCALGIATPLASWSAVGEAMRKGVLVRDASVFETLPQVRTVLFDKTGTLTAGERVWEATHEAGGRGTEEARAVAAALATASDHPASRGLRGAAAAPLPDAVRVLPGAGVTGVVSGARYWLGSRRLLEQEELRTAKASALDDALADRWRAAEERGRSVLALAREGCGVIALFELGEELRPETPRVLAALAEEGLGLEVLSGDAPAPARRLAERIGVPVHAALSPADKERLVAQRSASHGPVLYVGDGVNDAAALARADVSASLESATEVARSAADLVLLRDDLRALLSMRALARRTRHRIRFHLAWAVSYNPLFLFLAASGRLSPVLCALAMAISSVLLTTFATARRAEPAWTPSWKPSPSVS